MDQREEIQDSWNQEKDEDEDKERDQPALKQANLSGKWKKDKLQTCIVSERLRRNASHPDLPANPCENLFPTNLPHKAFSC